MDKQIIALLIPLFAVSIPVLAVTFWGLTKLARAKAEQRGLVADGETLDRLAALEEQVGGLERQLLETQERLDFAERLLAQPREHRPPS